MLTFLRTKFKFCSNWVWFDKPLKEEVGDRFSSLYVQDLVLARTSS